MLCVGNNFELLLRRPIGLLARVDGKEIQGETPSKYTENVALGGHRNYASVCFLNAPSFNVAQYFTFFLHSFSRFYYLFHFSFSSFSRAGSIGFIRSIFIGSFLSFQYSYFIYSFIFSYSFFVGTSYFLPCFFFFKLCSHRFRFFNSLEVFLYSETIFVL